MSGTQSGRPCQDGTDLGSIMGLVLSQGGTVPEQCKNLLSLILGRHFRKTSHVKINYGSFRLILFLGDKRMNIYLSGYVS